MLRSLNCYFSVRLIAVMLAGMASGLSLKGAVAQSPQRYLIIHADDAGMSHSVNVATAAGLESGIVNSASIMVPCPWFLEFAKYAKEHPQFDYGIHLTLNSEWDYYRWGPVAPRDRVPSLVDADGYLWDNVDQVAANAKADEIRIEFKAQIDKAIAAGVPLSHLDTHMGSALCRPDIVDVYVDLAIEYNLPVLFFAQLTPEMESGYPAFAARFHQSVLKLNGKKLPLLNNLLQYYGGNNPREREQQYMDALRELHPGVTQLIIHCGYDDVELRAITSSSARRDQDREIFTDPKVRSILDEQKVERIDWKRFRELTEAASGK